MKLRSMLAGTALAALALATDAGAPLGTQLTQKAEAAVNISFSVFYDGLDDHGDWVRYDDNYVFIPREVDDDWRPYTRGHWVFAERYGWTWASDEPFGWATYHYGRWGYADDIGWYWVPGKRWAPAWVSWRRSSDYIVWAPLPPRRGDDVDMSISITVGDIPEFYWVAVPTRRFLSPDVHVVIVDDGPEFRQVVERTEFVGAPRITNNIVVNNVIDVDVIAQATGEKVRAVQIMETTDPSKASATDQQVTVFQGEVTPDKEAKPEKVRKLSEVEKVKRSDEKAGDTTASQPVPTPDATPRAPTGAPTKAMKNAADVTAPDEDAVEAPPLSAAEEVQPDKATKPARTKPAKAEKPAPAEADDQQPSNAAEETQPEEAAKPARKPAKAKKKAPAEADDQQPSNAAEGVQAPADQPAGEAEAQPDPSDSKAAESPTKGNSQAKAKKKNNEEQPCDPAGTDCPPAQ